MAVTAFDRQYLPSSDIASLQQATADWQAASLAGDMDGMTAARNAAEAIRNRNGYSSNDDGSFKQFNSQVDSLLNRAQTIAQTNTAASQQAAQAQWDFNASEAQKARDWSEYMSSTAHQREVNDLIAAGLNPVLSAGGSGASSGQAVAASGSSAQVDTSLNGVLGSLVSSFINSETQIKAATISAETAKEVANINGFWNYRTQEAFPNTMAAYIARLAQGTLPSGALGQVMIDALGQLVTGADSLPGTAAGAAKSISDPTNSNARSLLGKWFKQLGLDVPSYSYKADSSFSQGEKSYWYDRTKYSNKPR